METAEFDFEAPALKLERHVAKLCRTQDDLQIDLQQEIDDLRAKAAGALQATYRGLSAWQISKVARHPQRPHALHYIETRLHRLRRAARRPGLRRRRRRGRRPRALRRPAGGGARAPEGAQTKENLRAQLRHAETRGLPQGAAADGAGRALRLPLVSLDRHARRLPGHRRRGARPGRGHRAKHLPRCRSWRCRSIAIVIGEGGSGGALAIGVGDRV